MVSEINICYIHVLNGALAIGPRPRLKKLKEYRELGTSHIWTLLSDKEGALDIKKATNKAGLKWLWLPLANAKPPEEALFSEINQRFSECKSVLQGGGSIYLHCSAGIHRTGMILYAFLRYLNYSESESLTMIGGMRALTLEGVGPDRVAWGNVKFGSQSTDRQKV